MKKSEVRAFQVNIPSLKNGHHQFQYEINDEFFDHFDNGLVEKGMGACSLALKKSETMMVLNFTFDLTIELICDRSLESFQFPVNKEEELIVKFGEEDKELTEEMIVISNETQIFEVAPYIHEFISLSVPMKKLHPKFEGQETPDLVYQTEVSDEESDEIIDPRWEELKKLK